MASSRQVDKTEDLAAAIASASTPANIVAFTTATSTSLGRVISGLSGSAGVRADAGLDDWLRAGPWAWGRVRRE